MTSGKQLMQGQSYERVITWLEWKSMGWHTSLVAIQLTTHTSKCHTHLLRGYRTRLDRLFTWIISNSTPTKTERVRVYGHCCWMAFSKLSETSIPRALFPGSTAPTAFKTAHATRRELTKSIASLSRSIRWWDRYLTRIQNRLPVFIWLDLQSSRYRRCPFCSTIHTCIREPILAEVRCRDTSEPKQPEIICYERTNASTSIEHGNRNHKSGSSARRKKQHP